MEHLRAANMLSKPEAFLSALLIGVSLHLFIFRKGEWDLASPKLLIGAAVTPILAMPGIWLLLPDDFHSLWDALKSASRLTSATICGIYLSMAVYRLAFHRLNCFPGPFIARLSNFYITYLAVRRFHKYEEVRELHRKYGDIVRIGASELSIANPGALPALLSGTSPCTKGPRYNFLSQGSSLLSERDGKRHALRRRVWDRGFSMKALRNYESIVAIYTEKLLEKIEAIQRTPLDVSLWFNFYSFDVMGDLSFGKNFGMLHSGIVHYYMKSLRAFMLAIGAVGHIMWIYQIFERIPILNAENKKFQAWVKEQATQRMKNPPEISDIFSWVLDEYNSIPNPTERETQEVFGDALLITVAGSDTTSSSLTCLFLELATHPKVAKTLQAEVDEYFNQYAGPDHAALSRLKYLQACIYEALRLYPAVMSGVQRLTPPEGLQIDRNTWIPGDTIVQAPTYTLHRDKRNFSSPDDYIPDRWTSKPELIKDASVFAPFSIGPHSCVGRHLALMEICYVTSQILYRYDVALAPGQTKEAFIDGLVDSFTLTCPKLDLVFTPRAFEELPE